MGNLCLWGGMHWLWHVRRTDEIATLLRIKNAFRVTGATPIATGWTLPIGQRPNMKAILASATIRARPDILAGAATDQPHALDRCINGQACTHRIVYSTPPTVHIAMLGHDLP
jgi:hypothetical protein